MTPIVYSQLDTTNVNKNSVESSIDSVNSQLDSSPQYVQLDLFQELVGELVDKVDEVVEKVIPANPINHWEKLDLAVERGYILSSSEVKTLVGIKPKGKEWIRGAFKFIRSGKIGNQAGWRVTRVK